MITEKPAFALPGWPTLFALIAVSVASTAGFVALAVLNPSFIEEQWVLFTVMVIVYLLHWILYGGFTAVAPNEARAIILVGRYKGTLSHQGFWFVNPFAYPRKKISIKIRNFESARLKVNDHDGNPIEIAAVVVWKVVETAEALFEVDDYEQFLKVQTEAAIRNVVTSYPYDSHIDGEISLRGNPHEIGEKVITEIQGRLQKAGIDIMDARISHLAYAPEIANAMLRRQQANAVIAARTRIVEGAVSMVEMALEQLSAKKIVKLDEERKAAMVSNLLVVLCSEHETQPVVNTGTLYQG
jgi:regulator of protease activity HflC (stomatin/prohibitin superfamily)